MRLILIAVLILLIATPINAEVWHEDTQEYRLERARDRLDEFKQMNWDWSNYSNRERSEIRAQTRELQGSINSGYLSYKEAYGESAE